MAYLEGAVCLYRGIYPTAQDFLDLLQDQHPAYVFYTELPGSKNDTYFRQIGLHAASAFDMRTAEFSGELYFAFMRQGPYKTALERIAASSEGYPEIGASALRDLVLGEFDDKWPDYAPKRAE